MQISRLCWPISLERTRVLTILQESVAANDSKRAQLAEGHKHNDAVFADLKRVSEGTFVLRSENGCVEEQTYCCFQFGDSSVSPFGF